MPTPEADLQGLLLGALLHDVGKLYLRSGRPHSPGYDGFTPGDYGAHGAHAKWSADFIERLVSPDQPVRPHDILAS